MGAERSQMLSHYRLVEKIGEGGMGVVWKADDTVLNRTVAIKVLPADLALDEERRRMFLDKARLAASVSQAHIVQVHEHGREGDLDFRARRARAAAAAASSTIPNRANQRLTQGRSPESRGGRV